MSIEVRRIGLNGIDKEQVTLESFSKHNVLAHAGIKQSQLIENDPEDEDNAYDFTVDVVGTNIVASIFNPDQESIKYIGPIMAWEG